MKKALLLSAFLVVALGAFAQEGTMMKGDKPAADGSMMKAEKPAGDGSMMKGDAMMKGDSMMEADAMMDRSAFDVRGLGKQVMAFTSEKDAQMLAKNQTVVYFFAATWCPTCMATHKDVQANFAKLPMGVTLVYVNYDKSADLKKKYGVTSQHTFVVVGPAGEKRKVWNGTTTVADIAKNAKMM